MKFVKAFSLFIFITLMSATILIQDAKSQPHDGRLGLGVVIGEPSGITGKYWLNQRAAFAGATAWSFRGNTTIHMHLDYARHNFEAITVNKGSLAFFYGLGGRILIGDTDRIGVRIPFGLSYNFENDPLEIFLELAPILDLTPGTEFTGNSGLGLRYYF